jgi:hypothetical protein
VKRQPTDWEKKENTHTHTHTHTHKITWWENVFASYSSNKGLIPRI